MDQSAINNFEDNFEIQFYNLPNIQSEIQKTNNCYCVEEIRQTDMNVDKLSNNCLGV